MRYYAREWKVKCTNLGAARYLSFAGNYNRRSIYINNNFKLFNRHHKRVVRDVSILNRDVNITARDFHYLKKKIKKLRDIDSIASCLVDRRRVGPRSCSIYDCFSVSLNSILFFIRLSSSRLPRMHPCRHPSNVVEKYCKPHGTTFGPYKSRSCIDFGRPLFHSNHPTRLTLATHTTSLSSLGAI